MKLLAFRPALALVLTTVGALSAQAQSPYVGQALDYSRLQFGGPARTQGLAGANVALGADFGNLSSNPAGLGLYQKSELHLAPGLGLGSGEGRGNGGPRTADQNSFHIGSAGVVLTNRRPDGDAAGNGWRGGSFGLGFTRQADFNKAFRYTNSTSDDRSFFQYLNEPGGYSDINSPDYQQAVADIATQYDDETYTSLEGLAYGNYLTNIERIRRPGGPVGDSVLVLDAVRRSGPITQNESVISSGSLSQFDLAYGGSYRDRVYVGGGVGIVSLNHERTSIFSEDSEGAQDFETRDRVKTTGAGINARLGIIYRLSDFVRLGASVQTPTYIRLTDTYSTSLTVNNDFLPPGSGLGNSLSTVPGTYNYSLVTPFRANGGVAVLVNKYGFLTGDIEYVGYSQARYSSNPNDADGDDYSFQGENADINDFYKSTVNVRLGAEGRFDIFRLRAGFAHYGDPYRNGYIGRAQRFYTAGAGLRQGNFFLDVAGVYSTYNQQHSSYALARDPRQPQVVREPVIDVTNKRFTTTLTAGLTF
ncbi:hypothetical protein [uncultured Hymenobacter sp.]|uniref:hypothetical protein n=1 Tax=uncultured Hymenobacter sp. TaxID=170016 RepID=UPI0035C947B3